MDLKFCEVLKEKKNRIESEEKFERSWNS
jgi:hypothetical protein